MIGLSVEWPNINGLHTFQVNDANSRWSGTNLAALLHWDLLLTYCLSVHSTLLHSCSKAPWHRHPGGTSANAMSSQMP